MKQNILYFIFGLLFGFAVMFFFNELKNKCILGIDKQLKKNIQKLIRQASRWSTAAAQDDNTMIALLHANYGGSFDLF